MPSVTYSGSFGGVAGSNGLTATLKAAHSIPASAVITNVSYSLRITAGGYSSSNSWILDQLAVGGQGGTPSAYSSATMYDNEHTFSGNMNWLTSDVSKFSSDTITVYAAAYTTHSSTSYLWEVEITVEYAFPEQCVPPSMVTINGSASNIESAAETATLAWSGAEAGAYNSISGYFISCYDSTDGSSWYLIDESYEVATTATSGSVTVNIPAVGIRRMFKVRTLSIYGTPYSSMDGTESPVVHRKSKPTPAAYTDPVLILRTTRVKAIHMLELQNNINALRVYYGLGNYPFTSIRAGYTSLAGWNDHIREMRTAIDAITTNHEEWLDLGYNAPRCDVLVQLRRVVAAL